MSVTLKRISAKRAAQAELDRPEIDALKALVTRCEFCHKRPWEDEHHVCQGYGPRGWSDGRAALTLLVCRVCHDELHCLSKVNRAIALALLHYAGRLNLSLFYRVMRRRYPDASDVSLWIDRLGGNKR